MYYMSLPQGIQYDKRLAMMEFQLRNFQVRKLCTFHFIHHNNDVACLYTALECDFCVMVTFLIDADGGYKGHSDVRAKQVHTEGARMQTSQRSVDQYQYGETPQN